MGLGHVRQCPIAAFVARPGFQSKVLAPSESDGSDPRASNAFRKPYRVDRNRSDAITIQVVAPMHNDSKLPSLEGFFDRVIHYEVREHEKALRSAVAHLV